MKIRYYFVLAALFMAANFLSAQELIDELTLENPGFDRAWDMVVVDDGYVLTGVRTSNTGNYQAYVVKFNNDFDLTPVWEYEYGDASDEGANAIIETSDGFVITGRTAAYSTHTSDAFVMKLNPDGSEAWTQPITFGGTDHDEGQALVEVPGGYIIGGNSVGDEGTRSMLLRLVSHDGTTITDLTDNYYNSGGTGMNVVDMEVLDDGIALLGYSGKIAKCDFSGSLEDGWELENNHTSSSTTYDFSRTADGGFIITGASAGAVGSADYYLSKISASGQHEWSQYYGGETVDLGFSVVQTPDLGYLMSGSFWSFGNWSNDEIGLIKTNATGDVDWLYIHEDDGIEWGYTMKLLSNGEIIVAGSNATLSSQDADFYLAKFAPPYERFSVNPNPGCTGSSLTSSPGFINPLNTSYNWVWKVYDDDEVLIDQGSQSGSVPTLQLSSPIAGSYNVSLTVNGKTYSRDFLVGDVIADFSSDKTFGFVGETFSFFDESSCGTTSLDWTFQDGTASSLTVANPMVSFSSAGPKTVSLTATNLNGTDTKTVPGYAKIYCGSEGDPSKVYIAMVSLNNVGTSSGAVGYENYTDKKLVVKSGDSFTVNLTPGQAPGKPLRLDWRVWADFNLNGIFEDSELVVNENNKKGEVSGTINVPSDAVAGSGIIRVAVYENFGAGDGPCEVEPFFSGEVEDYGLVIDAPANLPPVIEFEATPTLVEVGETVYFTDMSYNDPTSWTWELNSPALENPIELSDQNPVYTFSELEIGIYDVSLTASNDVGENTKTKLGYLEVIANGGSTTGDYCPPEIIYIGNGININSVTINGTQFADNFNTNGYSYYSDDIFVLQPGEVCNIALDPNTYGRTRFFWRVWFDLNDDGFFDENELMFSANNKKTLVEGTFTIPGDATYEDSRIRVSMKESSGQLGPCESGFEGEVEDYRLMTSPPPPDNLTGINKLNKVDFDVSIYPNPAKDKQLIIELENLVSNVQISVFDTYGSLIDQFETQQANNTLNVSDYAKGVYFVKVIHAGEMNVLKFVKQ